ncbi:pyridoxal phosphate-dependent aminotransferase [Clostridium botulinum]|uniref:cysteine-S-conjugate beta-lyase n=1 Tax=Clostridium botulinum (strain Okra / Type B1) TaxID=498213 RepID=B1IN58_CLOBK|nr:MalY/PatB family protein [Clostridium botulinum]ACA46653.1 aminotransferase, classes I and II [Clostridium botulinum B1 str. Okra]MBD5572636.1 pyridoxal phosphate-dependent aminotransferase [Clostridium botulinum]MBD5581933.1 pyridoxal phosphate-dependent aminotransferase [Clostridium botulinum]MBD5589959.1 pyridoxal phosphate-dependent aminotransferase [Clostridium botulinum]MBD5623129.1 pyridoxal phosphate-dependent aminotransferase [Clostridium botulinum]
MKYDFDEIIDRSNNRAAKYDERVKKFGTSEVIPLWIADMDFRTAQPIIDACKRKAEEGVWGYTSRPDSYFKAVQEWEKRRNQWDVDVSLMSWSLGVVPALSAIVKIFSHTGDKILIQTPVYSEFYDITEAWGRVVIENQFIEKNGKWYIDFEDFEKKAKECKIFLLCNPHNPLGIVWEPEELKRMAEICIANDVLLVSDEIHSDLIFHGKKHTPTATLSKEVAKKIITCVSATKTFNLAGLQASTTIFPNEQIKQKFDGLWMNMDIQRNNAFSSVAMEVAYNEGEEWLTQLLAYVSENFDFIKKYFDENIPKIKPNVPDATYLVWLDCRELGMSNEELRDFMVHKAGLGLNEGCSFGRSLSGYMRLNAACPRSVLEQALKQLKEAIDKL